MAENEKVEDLIHELLEAHEEGRDLKKSPAQKKLRNQLSTWLKKNEARGYFVFAPSGISISSLRDQNIGMITPVIKQGSYFLLG